MKDTAADIALTRRLRAAGVPIPVDLPSESPRDLIIEVARPEMSVAYDVRRGGIEFVFAVRITNRSYARLTVERFRASLPWASEILWRGDPRISSPEKTVYRLENGRGFSCQKILNYSIVRAGMLEPGGCLEGFLLGYTLFDRIPYDYMHGDKASADLCAVDQFDRPHWARIEMLIDRAATMRPVRPAGSGSTLFDGPKPESLFSRNPLRTRSKPKLNDLNIKRDQVVPGL